MYDFIDHMRSLQQNILDFLESESNLNEDFEILKNYINEQKIYENKFKFTELLYIISNVSKYHRNHTDFNNKIEKILLFFKDKIKESFSNEDIFDLFKSNKRVLLFLIKNKIIIIDKKISNLLYIKYESKSDYFFHPEIKQFIIENSLKTCEEDPEIFSENFDHKREIGENESYICSLIRQDSVEQFVTYVTKTNFPLSSRIKPSIFETHLFLLKNRPTLIAYAIYNDAIQIIRYLLYNKVKLKSYLWTYAIHSNSARMVYLFEEYKIRLTFGSFTMCLCEAIKCHHNNITEYILNKISLYRLDRTEYFSIRYRNYIYYKGIESSRFFLTLCKYRYYPLIIYYLQLNKEEMLEKISNYEHYPFKRLNNHTLYYYMMKDKSAVYQILKESNKYLDIAIPPTFTSIDNNAFK